MLACLVAASLLSAPLAPTVANSVARIAQLMHAAQAAHAIVPASAIPATTAGAADGVWSDLAPPLRTGAAAAFDAAHDRVLLVGGSILYGSNGTTEVWELRPDAIPAWRRLVTTGDGPPVRSVAFADPARDRLVVAAAGGFGGVWTLGLDDLAWTRLDLGATPPVPFYFSDASVAYDATRDRLLVFGGAEFQLHGPPLYHNDVWELPLSGAVQWDSIAATGTRPPPRGNATLDYDAVQDRLIVFGGSGAQSTTFGDVWTLDGATDAWSAMLPAGTPPAPRSAAIPAPDPAHDRLLLYGGGSSASDDLWALALDGAGAWSRFGVTGTLPQSRNGAAFAYDPNRDAVDLVGGGLPNGAGIVWRLALDPVAAWTTPAGVTPPGRNGAAYAADPARELMYVFGGLSYARLDAGDPFPFFGDLWVRDLANETWTELHPEGPSPGPRSWANAVVDPVGRRLLLFGGDADPTNVNEVWQLGLDGAPAWTLLAPTGTPPVPRWSAATAWDPVRRRMLVFGGASDGTETSPIWNDLWSLSFDGGPAWTQLTPSGGGAPAPRFGATLVYDPARNRMLLTGGIGAGGPSDSVWALSLGPAPTWSPLATTGTAAPRDWGPVGFYDPQFDRLVVFGAQDAGADVSALALATSTWSDLAPAGPRPAVRWGAAGVYDATRSRLVMFSGFTPGGGIGTVDYDDTWALASPPDLPTAVLVSATVDAALDGTVRVTWSFAGAAPVGSTVWRSAGEGRWIAARVADAVGDGRLVYVDRAPAPGERTGWRLQPAGTTAALGEVWADGPTAPALVLEGFRPDPARDQAVVAFTTSRRADVSLAVYDVAGRRVFAAHWADLEAGVHRERIGADRALPVGVYLIRLEQGNTRLVQRGVVIGAR